MPVRAQGSQKLSDRPYRPGAGGRSACSHRCALGDTLKIRRGEARRTGSGHRHRCVVSVRKGIDAGLEDRHTALMSTPPSVVGLLAATLRTARTERRLSIAQLATLANVSPRLISELERGMRAHVSFDTAARLLQLVDVSIAFDRQQQPSSEDAAHARAERRRSSWTGAKTTLATQAPPQSSLAAVERLTAVARASLLIAGLQDAHAKAARGRASKTGT